MPTLWVPHSYPGCSQRAGRTSAGSSHDKAWPSWLACFGIWANFPRGRSSQVKELCNGDNRRRRSAAQPHLSMRGNMTVAGHGRAWKGRAGDGASPSDSCRNRCSAEVFRVVPMDEIATAIARCAGCVTDSVAIGESIDCGEGRAIHYGGRQHDLLWPLSMSYDASAGRGDQPLLGGMRNAVSQEAPMPGRASRRRRSVHVSHSSFADLEQRFTIRLTTSSRNAGVAGLFNSLESQVTPELLSPIHSRSVPARPGCVRCLLTSGRRRGTYPSSSTISSL